MYNLPGPGNGIRLTSDNNTKIRVFQVHGVSPRVYAQMTALRSRALQSACPAHYPQAVIESWMTPPHAATVDLDGIADGGAFIAEHDGMLVGYGLVNATSGEIVDLFVDPTRHGQGAGALLVTALEELAARAGATCLLVSSTLNARAFFRRIGFSLSSVGEARHRSGFNYRTALMTKTINRAQVR